MSRSFSNTQLEATNSGQDEFNIYKEISQVNKNMGAVAEVIRTGIMSGDMRLLDNDNLLMFRSFTNNLCTISSKIMDIATIIEPSPKVITLFPGSVECNSDKSSLTNSVHNSDVTNDDGIAQEQLSCRWVSEFAGSSDDDILSIKSGHGNILFDNNPRKRKSLCTDDRELGNYGTVRPSQSEMYEGVVGLTPTDKSKGLTRIEEVTAYVSQYAGNMTGDSKYQDVVTALEDIILLCNNNTKYPYHAQSLVIFEHTSGVITVDSDSSKSSTTFKGHTSLSTAKFFEEYVVGKVTVIERPLDRSQVYVAANLGHKYHFSCPTTEITHLYDVMKREHNANLSILFIPRSCEMFESKEICVFNNVGSRNSLPFDDGIFDNVYDVMKENSNGGGTKRTSNSLSLGLQTMYSHQQHLFRYCMLPHSRPHIPTVKHYPTLVRKAIMDGYVYASKTFQDSTSLKDIHPFSVSSLINKGLAWQNARCRLRADMYKHMVSDDLSERDFPIEVETMFESCTVQPTMRLGFHRDVMNCPSMDKTIALHFPNYSNNDPRCISLLYYSRKCVGNYAQRQDAIEKYILNRDSCLLTKLCLKSLLHADNIFNYQASIFESKSSLKNLSLLWEKDQVTACPDIGRFSRTSCFKQGAAFDKMGYYSIFLNVFLSMHYMGILTTVDDSISLCMYFGLLCNGTSNLAATWVDLCEQQDFAKEWCARKKTSTKIFKLLVFLETRRREKDNSVELMGSCKLPRFQYANYAAGVIGEADLIHCYVKDFLLNNRTKNCTKDSDIISEHCRLFKSLSRVKGVGPLSFNQFWHSLSLCGVTPVNCIHSTSVAVGSGPAQLIQTFHPKCKSADALTSKLREVKAKLHNLGISSATDFFLENMMCELTRLGNKSRLASKKMSNKERKDGFLSDEFSKALIESKPTKNPDIYYINPFTGEYQHVFRVIKKDLLMRLSFLDNDIRSSVVVNCSITNCETTGKVDVSWSGDYVRRSKESPSSWFYS